MLSGLLATCTMVEQEKCVDFSRFDTMSTEELQEILRIHANGELEKEPDTEELFQIMGVLSKRRKQQEPHAFRPNEQAFADFCKIVGLFDISENLRYNPSKIQSR